MSDFLTVSIPESIDPLCVGIRVAAQLLTLSEKTVSEMVKEGKLPYVQPGGPGGKILFRIATLNQWLAKIETTAPPEKNPARRPTPRGQGGRFTETEDADDAQTKEAPRLSTPKRRSG